MEVERSETGPVRQIRVFIASPSDLAIERQVFKGLVDELNATRPCGAVQFEVLAWEQTLAVLAERSQGIINGEIDRCDVFVLAMYGRWGQPAPDALPYSSYTEEEFYRALDRWTRTRRPTILVFFKHVPPREMADPGPQLQRVLAFRKQLEDARQVLYRGFTDEAEFKKELATHLCAYARGELAEDTAARHAVIIPLSIIEEVQRERAEKERALAKAQLAHELAAAAVARAEALALGFAERAARAALAGRVEEARQDFARATDGTSNLRVLSLAHVFYDRTGDLPTAELLLERRLEISGRESETSDAALALSNLGMLYWRRGESDRAEETLRKSLAIEQKAGNQVGIARDVSNLGAIYQTRGELDKAETTLAEALALNTRLNDEVGLATNYSALGLVYRKRDELDRAEEMHNKSLALCARHEDQEGLATNYGNLGLIYRRRGDLDRAEEMHSKSLELNQKLGKLEGIATNYGNLGTVAEAKGARDRARELWGKARDLFTQIGMPHKAHEHQSALAAFSSDRTPASRSGTKVRLRGVSGDTKGQVWESHSEMRVGKLGGLEVTLADSSVSRRHAIVYHDGGKWHVRDLSSTNGTYLNGQKLGPEAQALKSRDIVQFGKVALLVEFDFMLVEGVPSNQLVIQSIAPGEVVALGETSGAASCSGAELVPSVPPCEIDTNGVRDEPDRPTLAIDNTLHANKPPKKSAAKRKPRGSQRKEPGAKKSAPKRSATKKPDPKRKHN